MSQITPNSFTRPPAVPRSPPPPPYNLVLDTPMYLLQRPDIAEPVVGAKAGALRVTEATPYALELRGRHLMAIALAIGGLALLAWFGGAMVLDVVHMLQGEAFIIHVHGFAFIAVGAFAVWTGLSRVGLSYRFDGRARTLHRQRLFGLVGGGKVWSAAEVHHILLKIASGKEDPWSGRERLIIKLMGAGAKSLTLTPIFGHPPTQTKLAETAARAAIAGARMLQVPVIVEGVVVKGRKELAALLTGQGR